MSRADGFSIADTDTSMMSDPKVLALARRLRDSVRTAAAVALYVAVKDASWKAGARLTLEDAAPGWWVEALDDFAAELVAVGLLDAEHRVPEHAWHSWFDPAAERRLEVRRKSIFGGLVSRGMTPSEANAESERRIAEERVRLNLKAQPIRLNPKAGPKGSTSYRSGPTGPTGKDRITTVRALNGATVEDATTDLRCSVCGDPLLVEPWHPVKADRGKIENVHDRCAPSTGVSA